MPRADYIVVVHSSGVQVDPPWVFLGSHKGQKFSSGGQAECFVVAPEFPVWRGVGQECEDGSLRTPGKVRVFRVQRFGLLCRG